MRKKTDVMVKIIIRLCIFVFGISLSIIWNAMEKAQPRVYDKHFYEYSYKMENTIHFDVPPIPEHNYKKMYYTVEPWERYLLAQLVNCEGDCESLECQIKIVSVVFNRIEHPAFNTYTIYDTIFAPSQFSVASYVQSATPNETNFVAVDYVLGNGPTLPGYVCFFRSGHYFSGLNDYCHLNNTYFSYKTSHYNYTPAETIYR